MSSLSLDPQNARWVYLHEYPETDSTQRLAKEAAEKGAEEGHLFIAERQTHGKGQFERVWFSDAGGLWFSFILRPSSQKELSGFSQLVGLTIVEMLQTMGITVYLKRPNDVLLSMDGTVKKVAGILVESSVDSKGVNWVVVGVGMNLINPIAPEILPIAISLSTVMGERSVPSREKVLNAFLKHFRPLYDTFLLSGFKPFEEKYNRIASFI